MKKAHKDCLKLWEYLAETGMEKQDAIKSVFGDGIKLFNNCPLCEKYGSKCVGCPLNPESCLTLGYGEWYMSSTKATRKKAASKFLNVLLERLK